jgi:uncharacterized protein (UPF0548 family)
MFFLRRPSDAAIERVLAASNRLPLSYGPIGLARRGGDGFAFDELATVIGRGDAAFAVAKAALAEWKHFDLGWVQLFPRQASIAPGSVVAVLIRHLGMWSLNGCRVVYDAGEGAAEFGFAYGTLNNHAECGEEIFKVTLRPDTGEVSYVIRAASRPHAPLARLGHPIVRLLQARFRRDSAAAMKRAVAIRQPRSSPAP